MRCDLHATGQCSGVVSTYGCSRCQKEYNFCAAHVVEGGDIRAGHGLRVHPADNPEVVAALRKSPEAMSCIVEAMKTEPEMWKALADYIAEQERKNS